MATDLNYLIPRLRLKLGDLTPPYKYLDEWLHLALVASVDALQRWWNDKYIIDVNNRVYRNTSVAFSFTEPPTIERRDIQPIILMAAIIFATAPFLYLLVRSPWQLVLVRIYHGLATAILGPVALAAVADTFETCRGERMGWYSSATMVGRFLAPFVGGVLIIGQDFHWVYLADGFAGVLALVAAIRLPRIATKPGSMREAFKRQHGK